MRAAELGRPAGRPSSGPQYWRSLLCLYGITPTAQPLARRRSGLAVLPSSARRSSSSTATSTAALVGDRRLCRLPRARDGGSGAPARARSLRVAGTAAATASVTGDLYAPGVAVDDASIVLDAALDDLSAGQTVAIVDWDVDACDVAAGARRTRRSPGRSRPAPPTRASKLEFAADVPTLAMPGGCSTGTDAALDGLRRRPARGCAPLRVPGRCRRARRRASCGSTRRRRSTPARIAVADDRGRQADVGGARVQDVRARRRRTPGDEPDAAGGLIVDLVDGPPAGTLVQARASANLARVRHGTTASAVLGSGDATQAAPALHAPDAPIAYDLDAAGNPVPTQVAAGRRRQLGRGPEPLRAGRVRGLRRRLDAGRRPDGRVRRRRAGRAAADRPQQRDGTLPRRRRHGGRGRVERDRQPARQRPRREEGRGRRADERRRRPGRRAPICARSCPRRPGPSGVRSRSRTSSTSASAIPASRTPRPGAGAGPPGCACGGSRPPPRLRSSRHGRAARARRKRDRLARVASSTRGATQPSRCACARPCSRHPLTLTAQLAVDPRRAGGGRRDRCDGRR